VNHKLVPLSHRLASGDQVEVLTSHTQQPKAEWNKYLVTAKGKTRLRAALKHDRRMIIDRGERRLQTLLAEHNVEPTGEVLSRIISAEHAQNKEDLYFMIGNDEIALNDQLLASVRPQQGGNMFTRMFRRGKGRKPAEEEQLTEGNEDGKIDTKKVFVLQSVEGVSNYTIASCCHPIPGDDVVGYVNERGEVIVHKLDCPTAMRLKSVDGGRLVQTRWDASSARFPATIHVEGIDRLGILQEIIYIISTNMAINMRALNIRADQGVFKCDLNVLIADVGVVTNLCNRRKRVKGVNTATMVNS
jgi:GTP pyrophosphokinase